MATQQFGPRIQVTALPTPVLLRPKMREAFAHLWREDRGEDIAEYAVMLAVILAIAIATIRLLGTQANNVFSSVASSIP